MKIMKNLNLEERAREFIGCVSEKTKDLPKNISKGTRQSLEFIAETYEKAYSTCPIITNYFSSAVGTIGGDSIAKQFTEDPTVRPRDIAFTASAAIMYSYLAPKMIEWSTKITDKVSNLWDRLKENEVSHRVFNAFLLTGMYFPVNMAYWNYLTVKNQAPITLEDNLAGAVTLGIATIPYLFADYIAIKKFSQPDTVKFLRPFYSVVEILWNTLFAGGNYLAKRL